jgi:hypothetical protein
MSVGRYQSIMKRIGDESATSRLEKASRCHYSRRRRIRLGQRCMMVGLSCAATGEVSKTQRPMRIVIEEDSPHLNALLLAPTALLRWARPRELKAARERWTYNLMRRQRPT